MPKSRHAIASLVLAALFAIAIVLAWELFWRSHGYEPGLADNKDLWAQFRDRAVRVDQATSFTVIGASRIQLAFAADVFEQAQPGWKATSLAINGHYPTAVLEDLARDERFRGVVLMAVDARGLAHWYRGMSEPWVRHYRRDYGPQRRLERRLLSRLQIRLVAAGADFNLVRRISGWIDGHEPFRNYTRLLGDRTIAADYRVTDIEALRAGMVAALAEDYERRPAPEPRQWLADLAPIIEAIDRIRSRGGEVVLLRMPTSGEHLVLDEANYPRAQYWDRLAAATEATTIYFADWPELVALDLPDSSHIDQTDRERFTRELVRIFREVGVLPEP